MMSTVCAHVVTLPSSMSNIRARWVMVQKRNRMQRAESRADMMLTQNATFEGSSVNCVKKLPVSIKNGAPGG